MIIDKNTIYSVVYISEILFFKLFYFYSENSLKGYTLLVSPKNILIAEILKYSTIYLAYQT